jgi:NHLM bacteriocin system ABC transporter peptidase/ATP-binding protein
MGHVPAAKHRPTRVKTPTVLQMQPIESGAAALAMVLAHLRRFVPLEELRVACGVSRDGTTTAHLVKGAARYGLVAQDSKCEVADLRAMPLPAVAGWGSNHFVVLEGFGKDCVYLNDPARGPTAVPEAEFAERFTGDVVTFEPGPDFKPGGHPRGLIRPLRQRLAGMEIGLVFVVLASLLLMLPGLVAPVLTGLFVDRCLVQGHSDWVFPLLEGMLLTAVLRAGLTWLQGYYLLRLETKLALTSSYRFFRHLLSLPYEFFTHRYRGEIGSRVGINDRIAVLLSSQLASHVLNAAMAAFYLILMFCYDALLTCVGLVIAVLNILALRYVSRSRRDVNSHLLQEQGNLWGTSMAGLQAIETLKATGGESDFFSRWSGILAKVMVGQQQMSLYGLFLGTVPSLLSSLGTVAILGLGARHIMSGALTIGGLVAFQSFMASFLGPLNGLLNLGASLQELEGQMNRLDDVLHAPVASEFSENRSAGEPAFSNTIGSPAPSLGVKLAGQLELRNVTFGYNILDRPLIEGFNLNVQPGARVALVGQSASGKSTLANLIAGLYQPWSGEILLDGKPRAQVARRVICNSLAMVDQDFFLLGGTVKELLTLWDETVPESEIVQAANDACIHDDIAARPGAYASKVDEGGGNFSGGQRQRLEIARALVVNPTLLILDEATSALDPVTEKQIDDNLRRRGCTCVIVAHRLSTIRDSDEIIVMDHGKIVERGTHDELCAAEGAYRQLINA